METLLYYSPGVLRRLLELHRLNPGHRSGHTSSPVCFECFAFPFKLFTALCAFEVSLCACWIFEGPRKDVPTIGLCLWVSTVFTWFLVWFCVVVFFVLLLCWKPEPLVKPKHFPWKVDFCPVPCRFLRRSAFKMFVASSRSLWLVHHWTGAFFFSYLLLISVFFKPLPKI